MITDLLALQAQGLARAFTVIVPATSILLGILFRQNIGIYFGLFIILMDVINRGIKNGLKQLYGDHEELALLGRGARPEGAKHCGSFVDVDSDGRPSSFGMPSGHAQVAFITGIFWTLYLHNKYGLDTQNVFSMILLWSICLGIPYSRVYFRCHTVQQVIVGGLLGLLFGSIGYYMFNLLQ